MTINSSKIESFWPLFGQQCVKIYSCLFQLKNSNIIIMKLLSNTFKEMSPRFIFKLKVISLKMWTPNSETMSSLDTILPLLTTSLKKSRFLIVMVKPSPINRSAFCTLKQLQPSSHQYREGEEYSVLHHIQNGSYGDVFCVRDRRTGFTCAAKRVSSEPVSHCVIMQISERCRPLIPDPTESLQQRGGEHVERSQLSSRGRALWSCEGGAQRCALHGLEAR